MTTIQKSNFANGLDVVSKAIPSKKPTIPVLANVRLTTRGKKALTLSATDLSLAITVALPATVKGEIDTTLSHKDLSELMRAVKELPGTDLEITNRGPKVQLACGKAMLELGMIPATEFPVLDVISKDQLAGAGVIGGADLATALEAVIDFADPDEEGRPVLQTIRFHFSNDMIHLAASDGMSAGVAQVRMKFMPPEWAGKSILLSARALAELTKIVKDVDDARLVLVDSGKMHVVVPNVVITMTASEGQFPAVENILPTDTPVTAAFKLGDLQTNIQIASLVNFASVFDLREGAPGTLQITARGEPAHNASASEVSLDGTITGSMTIGVNLTHVKKALLSLKRLKSPTVVLGFTTPTKPILIKAAAPGGITFQAVTSSMRLQGTQLASQVAAPRSAPVPVAA